VGSVPFNRVVLTALSGCNAASCWDILQVTGEIKSQSEPVGQQMAELASSRLMQVDIDGQQKSAGSFVLPHRLYEIGQESELRGGRSKA
jgi:predicted amino acid dehydrogenase